MQFLNGPTILELRTQVGILTLRRAILEWYRFLLCAEHIHFGTYSFARVCSYVDDFNNRDKFLTSKLLKQDY